MNLSSLELHENNSSNADTIAGPTKNCGMISIAKLPNFSFFRNAPPSPPNFPSFYDGTTSASQDEETVQREIQTMLAKDLNGLSFAERNEALNEIHGVSSTQDEDEEHVDECLELLEHEINEIPSDKRVAYDLAKSLSYEYVHNRDFRLMFLRGDRFDAKLAATRFVNFFQQKQYLFGPRKLVQDITLNDLNDDDIECLKSGVFQWLPCKDRSGRPVSISFPSIKKFRTIENALRASFYTCMSRIQNDIEMQKTGIVFIHYAVDCSQRDRGNMWKIANLRNCVPIKCMAGHVCYENSPQKTFLAWGISTVASYHRVRLRVHRGTHMECLHTLLTFGIPMEALPIDVDGQFDMSNHLEWVENQMNLERTLGGFNIIDSGNEAMSTDSLISDESASGLGIIRRERDVESCFDTVGASDRASPISSSTTTTTTMPMVTVSSTTSATTAILRPSESDVLFGRGRGMSKHPGNARFRKIIDQHVPQYEIAGKYEKTSIAENIVQIIKETDGRFLRLGKGGEWELVSDEAARNKVSHAFRARRY